MSFMEKNNAAATEDESLLVLVFSATLRRMGVDSVSFTEDELMTEVLHSANEQLALQHVPGEPWVFGRVKVEDVPPSLRLPGTGVIQ